MNLLKLSIQIRPGEVVEKENRFEVFHKSGEHSTIFKPQRKIVEGGKGIDYIYSSCDGADLFSSTFKISALSGRKEVDGVSLVEDLSSAKEYAESISAKFPEESIVFMSQAGIGIYAIGKGTSTIYEWDDELGELTEKYDSIEQILREWADAIG